MTTLVLLVALAATPDEIDRYRQRHAIEFKTVIDNRRSELAQARRFWRGVPAAQQKNRGFHTVSARERDLAEAVNPFGKYLLDLPWLDLQVGDIGRVSFSLVVVSIIDRNSFSTTFHIRKPPPDTVTVLPNGVAIEKRPDGSEVRHPNWEYEWQRFSLVVEGVPTDGLKEGAKIEFPYRKLFYVINKTDDGWHIVPFDPPK